MPSSSVVRLSVGRLSSTLFKIFSSETIEAKFHIELHGMENESLFKRSWSHDQDCRHGKKLKNFFSGTKRPTTLKLGMQHWVLEYYQFYSNDVPGLTLIYFTARSNLVPYAFEWEKGKAMAFSETIVVYDLKLATDDQSDKKFLLISKLFPLEAVRPLPRGYRHVLNHEKNV